MIIYLRHENSGKIKKVKLGFSWTIFFFGLWVPLFRRDFKVFIPFLLLYLLLCMFMPLIYHYMDTDMFMLSSVIDDGISSIGRILDLNSDAQVGILYLILGIIIFPFTLLGLDADFVLMKILSFTYFFMPLYIFINILGAFFYNRIYIQGLLKNGYYPMTKEYSLILQNKGIQVPIDLNQE